MFLEQQIECKKKIKLRTFMANNPMQQFSVHKIGPEIKIAGIDL